MPKTIARGISIGFFMFWLLILFAGADKPPPPGFILIIALDAVAALLVYLRIPVYIRWKNNHRKFRWLRVIFEGLLVGLVFGLVTLLFPGGGEPSLPPRTIFDNAIWLGVLSIVGAFNSVAVYSLSTLLSR